MTPKEKADYIVSRYRKEILNGKYSISGFVIEELSEQCALISVDEALNMFSEVHKKLINLYMLAGQIEDTATYQYWQEVKQEIENL